MRKKVIVLYCLTTILFFGSAEFAFANRFENGMTQACNIEQTLMPQYKATFDLPLDENQLFNSRFLILRFYQPWEHGNPTAWQKLVDAPEVFLDGEKLWVFPYFSYHNPYYKNGAEYIGFDQYAQYFYVSIPITLKSTLDVIGTFQQVAYLSASVYSSYNKLNAPLAHDSNGTKKFEQHDILDWEMSTLDNACNPYIASNPSVFFYSLEDTLAPHHNVQANMSLPEFLTEPKMLPVASKISKAPDGKIDIYRISEEDSTEMIADDIADDGCSRAYLYAHKGFNHEVVILRIKVPTLFLDGGEPNQIFDDYQTRYLSINSHHYPPSPRDIRLSFWGVHGAMLNQYKDEDGYAYVFFAPDEYTHELALDQNTEKTEPPVMTWGPEMTWGQYKGYLLGNPNYAIILRYRDPDPDWEGSPENAECYKNSALSKPVTEDELGDYLPEAYGDTMDNFLDGQIGAVSNEGPWPE